jgi:dTMP kinase
LIDQLERIATAGLQPDLTLWLDLTPALALKRRGDRPADRIESAGEAFLARVAAGFQELAEERGWQRIEAGLPADAVAQALQELLMAWARAGAVDPLPQTPELRAQGDTR